MLGDLGKLHVLAPNDPADQQGQCVEMTLLMAGAPDVDGVRQGAFNGTIVAKVGVYREFSDLLMKCEDFRCTPAFLQVVCLPPNADVAHIFCTVAKSDIDLRAIIHTTTPSKQHPSTQSQQSDEEIYEVDRGAKPRLLWATQCTHA
jgi:hypothetical protein